MSPIYITHTSAITPQPWANNGLTCPAVADVAGRLGVVEPDYSTLIPPQQLRRMSKVLKMGVFAGLDCMCKAGIERPDGIITGTGKGSMTDTEKFVKELKEFKEQALNPTPFILSTYNAVNGAIALYTQATGYNQTFVHRGSSFETSLYDAQLKLNTEHDLRNYLVGCFDEMTSEYFFVKNKIGYWKKDRNTALSLWEQENSTGTIAGEGCAFFMISNKPTSALVSINTISIRFGLTCGDLDTWLYRTLDKVGWQVEDIDMIVLGKNGDCTDEPFYNSIQRRLPEHPILVFKHLCGEYETAGSFGIWLTCQFLSGIALPDTVWRFTKGQREPGTRPKKILYYNHYRGLNHNLILLSAT